MDKYAEEQFESFDAAIFTGDLFEQLSTDEELSDAVDYFERWLRELKRVNNARKESTNA